jgi:hypothetical protein
MNKQWGKEGGGGKARARIRIHSKEKVWIHDIVRRDVNWISSRGVQEPVGVHTPSQDRWIWNIIWVQSGETLRTLVEMLQLCTDMVMVEILSWSGVKIISHSQQLIHASVRIAWYRRIIVDLMAHQSVIDPGQSNLFFAKSLNCSQNSSEAPKWTSSAGLDRLVWTFRFFQKKTRLWKKSEVDWIHIEKELMGTILWFVVSCV